MKQPLVEASATLVKVVPGLMGDTMMKWKCALEEPEHKLQLQVYLLTC